MAQAGSTDSVNESHTSLWQASRRAPQVEPEPAGISDGSEDARRVILKAALVQHANYATAKVRLAKIWVNQLPYPRSGQLERHRVDRKIAAREIVAESGGRYF